MNLPDRFTVHGLGVEVTFDAKGEPVRVNAIDTRL